MLSGAVELPTAPIHPPLGNITDCTEEIRLNPKLKMRYYGKIVLCNSATFLSSQYRHHRPAQQHQHCSPPDLQHEHCSSCLLEHVLHVSSSKCLNADSEVVCTCLCTQSPYPPIKEVNDYDSLFLFVLLACFSLIFKL